MDTVSDSFLRNRRPQRTPLEYAIWLTGWPVVGSIHILRAQCYPFPRLPRNVDCAIYFIPRDMEPNAPSSSAKPVPCMLSDGFCYPHQRVAFLVLH